MRILTAFLLLISPLAGADVNICVARHEEIPGPVEEVAKATARQLFEQIGVEVRYGCDAEAIALRIQAEAPGDIDRYAMGMASVGGGSGRQATIFYNRVMEFGRNAVGHGNGILLGYVIAHEIGHVLRGDPGHAPSGVMKACWSRADAAAMIARSVGFTQYDAERILRMMARRKAASAEASVD